MSNKSEYENARAKYEAYGVNCDQAIETLKNISVSLHCWQKESRDVLYRH